MRVLSLRLQFHQIDDVDNADLQLRDMLTEQIYGGQSLQRRHVPTTGHDDIRIPSLVVAGPFPDSDACRAVFDRLVHRQPLRSRLLARHDDVPHTTATPPVLRGRTDGW